MKKIAALFFFAGAVLFSAQAQDINKCEADLKAFEEQVQLGTYTGADELLAGLLKTCPKFSESIYRNGETVLNYLVESAGNDDDRKKQADALVALYKQYDKNFPANTNAGDVKAAMLLHRYKLVSDDDFYKKLDEAFKLKRSSFTDYNAIEAYFMQFRIQYESGKKGITQEQFIEKFADVSGQLAVAQNTFTSLRDALLVKQQTVTLTPEEIQLITVYDSQLEGLDAVNDNISMTAASHTTCEKLDAYYTAGFDANKENTAWLQGMAAVMFEKKCYNSAVLEKGMAAMYAQKRTVQSALYMAKLAQRKGNIKDAVAYYEEAVRLEKAPNKKTDLYYTIAGLLRPSDKGKTKEYLQKVALLDPKSAKQYILLAELYSTPSPDCNLPDFEKKALYWLAAETVKKAAIADAKYQPTADTLSAKYLKQAPTKEDVKAANRKKGHKITFGCWINETITIPNL